MLKDTAKPRTVRVKPNNTENIRAFPSRFLELINHILRTKFILVLSNDNDDRYENSGINDQDGEDGEISAAAILLHFFFLLLLL